MLGSGPSDESDEFFDCGEYYGALLNSPPMCASLVGLGTLVRSVGDQEDSYSHAERELVDQVLSVYFDTTVVQKVHLPDAVSSGVRIEAIEALYRGDDDALTPDERQLTHYIRNVVDGTVDDETWNAMLARMGTRGLVEYTVFITFLQLIIRIMQAFQVTAPERDEVMAMLDSFKSDPTLVPDFRQRIH